MTVLVEPQVDPITEADREALIKEARRLRRRRWFFGSTLVALMIGAGVGVYLTASGPPSGSPHSAPSSNSGAPGSPAAVRGAPTSSPDLIQPTTLASLRDGNVLILDSSRDQILELTPNGHLSVLAGTGRLGFSGDGGPARDANLDLGYFSSTGMSVTRAGAVDFLDDGDCRVRQITPARIIRTIFRVPSVKRYPTGRICPVSAFAASPSGIMYLGTSSEIDRVSGSGHLIWVAGSRGPDEPTHPARLAVLLQPDALAFDHQGDLFISSFVSKLVYELTPTGKLTKLGVSYADQLTLDRSGQILAGTHGGLIDTVTSSGIKPFLNVVPKQAGINWPEQGFQEDGITVTKSGTIYVDNAEGNGYGDGTVLVRIDRTKHASLAAIDTPLIATLPRVGAKGFPVSEYPAARSSNAPALTSCPGDQGLEPFTATAITRARKIARTYFSRQFASDIAVTDRSWWTGAFDQDSRSGVFSTNAIDGEAATSNSSIATVLAQACGQKLVDDSIVITVGRSGYADFNGTLYLLNRNGHPLVYDARK